MKLKPLRNAYNGSKGYFKRKECEDMGVQNPYNNYIKNQTKKPIDNFKEKVKNSLGGVATNSAVVNTPTQRTNATPVVTPPKPNNNTPKPVQTPVTPPTQPVNTPPVQTQPNVTQGTNTPIEGSEEGLMSISDMQKQFSNLNSIQPHQVAPANQELPNLPQMRGIAPNARAVNSLAQEPAVQQRATTEGKTPQQLAQELLQQQQDQLKKDWELKQKEYQMQTGQLNQQYEQSVKDAEKLYNQAIENIHDARYQQMEDLAVSGTSRGIQYSPQQLGLENVANINHGKNILKATEERNNLLNQLKTQINQSLTQINLGQQNAINEYNKAQANLFASYQKQMMDWTWDEKKTEEERKWQEHMANNDREWQKYMAEMQNKWEAEQQANQNKWQSGENALDREARNGRSGGGGSNKWASSGGYSYTPWTPWETYSGKKWSAWDYDYANPLANAVDFNDKITQQAYYNDFTNLSTDNFNAVDVGGMNDLDLKAKAYKEMTDPMYNYAIQSATAPQWLKDSLKDKRETALKHLYNKSYGRSTNTPWQEGNVVVQPITPVRDSYKKRIMERQNRDKYDYYKNNDMDLSPRMKLMRDTEQLHENIMKNKPSNIEPAKKSKPTYSKNGTKAEKVRDKRIEEYRKSTKKKNENFEKTKKTIKKSISNSKKNAKKSVENSKKNAKKSIKKSQNNTSKAVKKHKSNFKKSIGNALRNLKKNLFGR